MEDVICVTAKSTKWFETPEEARAYAIKLLKAGLTFIKIYEDKK